MKDHLAAVGVLVPALKRTLTSSSVNLLLEFNFAHFVSVQCLRVSSSIVTVLRVQRLSVHLSVSVKVVVSEAEAMTSAASSNAMKVRKPEPAEIEYKNMKFLITYRPTDATMDRFIEVSLLFSRELQCFIFQCLHSLVVRMTPCLSKDTQPVKVLPKQFPKVCFWASS